MSNGTVQRSGTPLSRRERIDLHRARAWALQVHYRWESAGSEGRSLADAFEETRAARRVAATRIPHIRRLVEALDGHLDEIDDALGRHLDNWRLDRLSALDRGVLRLAAAELLYFDDVPPKAVIQEAVQLAEAYGGDQSPRFVNGVLDALYRRDERP